MGGHGRTVVAVDNVRRGVYCLCMATGLLSFLSHDDVGTLMANTICVHWEPSGTATEEGSFANAVHEAGEWLKEPYRLLLSDAVVLDRLVLRGVGADDGKSAERAYGVTGGAGTANGQMPREVALTLALRTNVAGRSGKGHIQIPALRDYGALGASGSFRTDTAWWGHVTAFGNALLAGHNYTDDLFSTQHMSTRVWSRKHSESHDVVAFIARTAPRWVERRQTVP